MNPDEEHKEEVGDPNKASSLFPHLVVPGQVIAVSNPDEASSSFLRGHGTYIWEHTNPNTQQVTVELRASVTGTVQRVNKLLSVDSVSLGQYHGHVGDLVVGRIAQVQSTRWMVDLGPGMTAAALPLSAVHVPGSVQRIRTAADALEMRQLLQEGDLVSAEVHKVVPSSNTYMLHTRSLRYGKLENGCVVQVFPNLIPRQKTHFTSVCDDQFQVLLGCNGMIWIQRNNRTTTTTPQKGGKDQEGNTTSMTSAAQLEQQERVTLEEEQRKWHTETPYNSFDRQGLARLRNAIVCLHETRLEMTPEAMEEVYQASLVSLPKNISGMLQPEQMVRLTAGRRRTNT